MKSKKIHKIVLKNQKLKHVRNNLRIILKLTVKEELSRLSKLKELYFKKDKLSPSQRRRRGQLSRQYNNLYHCFIKSTLQCNSGAACISFQKAKKKGFNPKDRPTDLDLVWVPWLEKWFCVECFETFGQGKMTHDDFDDPVWREWVKTEFGI